jgi:preprotein translocase subunit YajC
VIAFLFQAQGASPEGSMFSTIIMLVLVFGIFYFLMVRPQQKKAKERQKMLEAVKKGDKIITAGGLHGVIAGIDDKTVLVQVADNVKLKFERTAVGSVIRESEPDTGKEVK